MASDRPKTHPTIDPLDASTWPDRCPKCDVELTKPRQCMGHSKRAPNKHCKDFAAEGQVTCRRHGGATPKGMAAAARRLQRHQLDTDIGLLLEDLEMASAERPVVDVLLDAVHRCAAQVQVWGALAAGLRVTGPVEVSDGSDDLGRLWGPDHLGDGRPHVIMVEYRTWLEQSAKAASLALRAGVEQKKLELVEQQAQLLATVIRGVVEDLGHDLQDERVREVVTGRLQLVRVEAA